MYRFPNRLLRIALWLLTGILALTLFAVTALWLLSRQDTALDPIALLARDYRPPTAQELSDDGYLILAGLDAASSAGMAADPVAEAEMLGRARLAREVARHALAKANHGELGKDAPAPFKADPAPTRADDILPESLRCADLVQDCVDHALRHRAELQARVAAHAASLVRYAAIADRPRFANRFPMYVEFEAPPYSHVLRIQELMLARATFALADGHEAEAMRLLDTAMRVPKRLARETSSLVDSMIAQATMLRQLHWISDLLRRYPSLHQPRHADALTRLIDQAQVPIGPALRMEQRHLASLLWFALGAPQPPDTSGWKAFLMDPVTAIGLHPHRTINATIEQLNPLIELSERPAHVLSSAVPAARQAIEDQAETRQAWFGLGNWVGENLVRVSDPMRYLDYIERAHDLDGYRRLVLLQLAACRAGIDPAAMPDWLSRSPEELRNPYTLAPMGWHAGSGSLVFQGRRPQRQNPDRSSMYRVQVFTSGRT